MPGAQSEQFAKRCGTHPDSHHVKSFLPVHVDISEHSIDERVDTICHERAEAKEIIAFKNNLCIVRKHQQRQAKQIVTRLQITLKEADKGDNVAVPLLSVYCG